MRIVIEPQAEIASLPELWRGLGGSVLAAARCMTTMIDNSTQEASLERCARAQPTRLSRVLLPELLRELEVLGPRTTSSCRCSLTAWWGACMLA